MRAPLRVAVVDDHPLTEPGLRTMLSAHPARIRLIQVTGQVQPSEVDLVLFEPVRLTVQSRALLRRLTSAGAAAVAYTWRESTSTGHAIISKALNGAALADAIEETHRRLGSALPSAASLADRRATGDLSPRESEILRLIAEGRSNDEIAAELGLSINSVKTYIRQAYRKIDVVRRSQAVAWYVQHHEAEQPMEAVGI
ncbi:response regulator transcription factor [Nocardioides sp. TRM66260-LWL]|uniref:response regulator transcription factor n=1 Tax=Nocardioides sp. TRM66260-LWL TaxID=2874478 RepID=UPI001CC754CA|nr:response regulator transcription factor [Nocardioides sp. TRM66260-LWL]MBZ5732921.1 response regulator transcription factor [Nocardioides sp. TRM66260-LWL]